MTTISQTSQSIVEQLLHGHDDIRKETLKKFPELPDKKLVADYLIDYLAKETDGHVRSWIVSGLAAMNESDAVPVIVERIKEKVESDPWTRYFALIGINQMQPDNLDKHLSIALKDTDELVRASALRLLIENGYEKGHLDALSSLMDSEQWFERWAACKVLRNNVGRLPLDRRIERLFLPKLITFLENKREAMDVRFQAAWALGSMTHETDRAVEVLGKAIKDDLPDWLRRACVDSLVLMAQPKSKIYLLDALLDKDAEIRVRASSGLNRILGTDESVQLILEGVLRIDDPPGQYFDALRYIDSKNAAKALIEYLLHPDPRVAERASRALARLGGEEALRTLQARRTQALDTYTELLGDADTKIMSQFASLMTRAQNAFAMSMWMHGIVFGIGVIILVASLYVAISQSFETFERYVGIGSAVGSLGTLLWLFYKDPLKNIRESVNSLMTANIVFLGYVRQINQIDATFKHMFLELGDFSIDQMKATVEQLQLTVTGTMDLVKDHLGTHHKNQP